jgi:hypothetical protein
LILFRRLPGEACLNVNEMGHKENCKKFWTWCSRAQLYTLFRIDKSPCSKVLIEALATSPFYMTILLEFYDQRFHGRTS